MFLLMISSENFAVPLNTPLTSFYIILTSRVVYVYSTYHVLYYIHTNIIAISTCYVNHAQRRIQRYRKILGGDH